MKHSRPFDAVPRDWAPPRELRNSPPRRVLLAGGGIAMAVLGLLLAAGGTVVPAYMATVSFREAAEFRDLQLNAQETEGRVLRKWYRKGENRRHFMEYEFDFKGRAYRNEIRVQEGFWKRVPEGGTIPVAFRASKPESSWLAGRPKRPLSIWAAVAAAAVGLGLAAVFAVGLRRQMTLLSEGRVAPGVVTKIQKVQHSHGSSTTISYEFGLLSGAVAKGKGSCNVKGLGEGSVVCVLYDPDNVGRSALYPFELTKVEKDR